MSHLNDTFGGEVSITVAIVSFLWRTILYRAGYYSRRVASPNHLSSQNLISDLSLILNDPKRKKCFFVAIRPAQKCESSVSNKPGTKPSSLYISFSGEFAIPRPP